MSDDNDPWQDLWKANLFHLSKFIGGKSFQLPLKGDEFTLLLGLVICMMSTAPGKLLLRHLNRWQVSSLASD